MAIVVHGQRKANKWGSVGRGLAEGINSALESYQKRQDEERQFARENKTRMLKNLEAREQSYLDRKQHEQILGKENEAAKQLGIDISGFHDPRMRQNALLEGLRGKNKENEQERLSQSFLNVQNLFQNPDLSDEQKVLGLYQELHQNPSLARNIYESLQKPGKARDEDIAGRQFSLGYNAIQEGDNDALKDVLEDPATSLSVKNKLTTLRDKAETRKGMQARELRQRQSMVQNAYKQAIANERAKIQKPGGYPRQKKEEIDKIAKNIKQLETSHKVDLHRLAKDPDSYSRLKIWDNDASRYLPEEIEEGNEEYKKDLQMDIDEFFDNLSDAQIEELFEASGGDIETAKKLALERYGE